MYRLNSSATKQPKNHLIQNYNSHSGSKIRDLRQNTVFRYIVVRVQLMGLRVIIYCLRRLIILQEKRLCVLWSFCKVFLRMFLVSWMFDLIAYQGTYC